MGLLTIARAGASTWTNAAQPGSRESLHAWQRRAAAFPLDLRRVGGSPGLQDLDANEDRWVNLLLDLRILLELDDEIERVAGPSVHDVPQDQRGTEQLFASKQSKAGFEMRGRFEPSSSSYRSRFAAMVAWLLGVILVASVCPRFILARS